MGGHLTAGKGSLCEDKGAGEARKASRVASGLEAEAESLLGSQELASYIFVSSKPTGLLPGDGDLLRGRQS